VRVKRLTGKCVKSDSAIITCNCWRSVSGVNKPVLPVQNPRYYSLIHVATYLSGDMRKKENFIQNITKKYEILKS
jgi:hypothetical protein